MVACVRCHVHYGSRRFMLLHRKVAHRDTVADRRIRSIAIARYQDSQKNLQAP